MQGLLVFNAEGDLIHSRCMERAVIDTCIDFAAQHGASPVPLMRYARRCKIHGSWTGISI